MSQEPPGREKTSDGLCQFNTLREATREFLKLTHTMYKQVSFEALETSDKQIYSGQSM